MVRKGSTIIQVILLIMNPEIINLEIPMNPINTGKPEMLPFMKIF